MTGGTNGAALAALMLVTACAVTPASRYDEATDRLVTGMQRDAFGQWERMRETATPACRHAANLAYYRRARADAAALAFRADAIPLNTATVKLAARLDGAIRRLDGADAAADARGGCLSPAALRAHETEIGGALSELLALEISKLRNEKGSGRS